jgi:outer membrane lipoprotein-sorting protein
MKPLTFAIPAALAALVISAVPAAAQDAAARGLAVAQEVKKRDTGYKDFTATAKMTLRNAQGQTSVKEMNIKTLESSAEGEKALIIFTAPADTKDTVLLSHSFRSKADEQWLYLPSMKRTKRIASGNKSGSFVGSEFSYEDISPQQVEKYNYKFLREEKFGGQDCFVIERYPKDPATSGYTKQIVWIDKAEYRPLKAENYDRKNSLAKTLISTSYKRFNNKFWRPMSLEMVNHQTGKRTSIAFTDYKFGNGLGAAEFESTRLDRQ